MKEVSAKYLDAGDAASVHDGVPAGFKRTEVGVIPEDWSICRLSSFSEVLTGLTYRPDDVCSDGILVLRSSNIQNGNLTLDDNVFVRYRAVPEKVLVKSGDVLVCIRNGSRELIGKSAMIPAMRMPVAFGAFMAVLRSPEPLFVHQSFRSEVIQRQIRERLGATINQITRLGFNSFLLPVPNDEDERRAISQALSDADALIESLQQLIAKKRALKQGTMQALLTGRQRLPGFSQDWEVRKLGDFGDVYGGLSGKTKRDFGHGHGRFVTFMGVMSSVVVDMAKVESVDVPAFESQNEVLKGDLLFNGSSETPQEIGLCAAVAERVDGVYLNSFCFGYRMQAGAPLDPLYLAYFYRSNAGRELLTPLAQGAIRYNLSKRALLELEFELPSEEEQTAIATVLSDMDAEIDALEARLAKACDLKAGMMQALLTGRIRLPLKQAA